ncbi:MAG: DUF2854 domain-containing protein [Cyanobacteriota bacterium]|jgi:Protein of unknown function (DUF2854)|nr:DUF2854 domain-containing protein [Cyanobacteriota bacterium]
MQSLRSPGTLVTLAGAALTVIGSLAYVSDHPNLSLPTIFYGIPILLGGLALKSSELPPPERLTPPDRLRSLREAPANEALRKLLADVCRWRYGQKVHLESSLEALKLWDEQDPPSLLSVEECSFPEGYGLSLTFAEGGVPFARWEASLDRLGRFFGPGLQAGLVESPPHQLTLTLRPRVTEELSADPSPTRPAP